MEMLNANDRFVSNKYKIKKPFYFLNVIQLLFIFILLIYITYLLFKYINFKLQTNALLKNQNILDESIISIDTTIKKLNSDIAQESCNLEYIQKEFTLTTHKISSVQDYIQANILSINSLNEKAALLESNINLDKERLSTLQKDNIKMKQEIANKESDLDSRIIETKEDRQLIEEFVGKKIYTLCYSTSFGFSKGLMLRGCSDQSPTLLIVKGQNDVIIGGYTEKKWTIEKEQKDYGAFLFSLTQKEKYSNKVSGYTISINNELISFDNDLIITRMRAIFNPILFTKEKISPNNEGSYFVNLSTIEIFTFVS